LVFVNRIFKSGWGMGSR